MYDSWVGPPPYVIRCACACLLQPLIFRPISRSRPSAESPCRDPLAHSQASIICSEIKYLPHLFSTHAVVRMRPEVPSRHVHSPLRCMQGWRRPLRPDGFPRTAWPITRPSGCLAGWSSGRLARKKRAAPAPRGGSAVRRGRRRTLCAAETLLSMTQATGWTSNARFSRMSNEYYVS